MSGVALLTVVLAPASRRLAAPLPAVTDKPEVIDYMIKLSDALEAVREEHFMGWYHSHPFDVCDHSNAFLSATGARGQCRPCSAATKCDGRTPPADVSTQLAWQLPEDRAGNPWLALVVGTRGRSWAEPR